MFWNILRRTKSSEGNCGTALKCRWKGRRCHLKPHTDSSWHVFAYFTARIDLHTDVWKLTACQRGIEFFSLSCYVNTPTSSFVWSTACCAGFILVVESYSTHGPPPFILLGVSDLNCAKDIQHAHDIYRFLQVHLAPFSAWNGFGVRNGGAFGRWKTSEENLWDRGGIWPDRAVMKWKERDWKTEISWCGKLCACVPLWCPFDNKCKCK